MRIMTGALLVSGLLLAASFTAAQPPGGDKGGKEGRPGGRGPGRFGGPPRPGQILPDFLQEQLRLTDDQKKQVAELQKDVDAKLDKILTAEQKSQMKEMRERGPGGRGGRGPGGRPGGGRPGGDNPPPPLPGGGPPPVE
jgi:Spy/CpxP family protein refolding chaperone